MALGATVTGAHRDLVLIGTHPWSSAVPLGDWHLARALARRRRVLWVDPPASPRAIRTVPRMSSRRIGDAEIFVCSPLVPSGRASPVLSQVAARLTTGQVNHSMRRLGMTQPDVISFSPRLGALPGLRRRRLVAWLKDRDWAAAGVGHTDWLRARQAELVLAADLVTAVSRTLVADCRALGVQALHLPNGCDLAAYAKTGPEPVVLRPYPRPRVLFAGAWNERVDPSLVDALAAAMPEVSVLLIGEQRVPVPRRRNVHVLGAVSSGEVPALLQAGDVGIVPYRRSPFNDASCPLKVYEYLAAGLPVVVSGVDVDGADGLVQRHDDAAGFVAAVASMLTGDRRAACLGAAAHQSWDERADRLLTELDGFDDGDNER